MGIPAERTAFATLGYSMDDMSQYTDDELRELYNWLTTQHRLVEDELAWRSRCEDLDQDK